MFNQGTPEGHDLAALRLPDTDLLFFINRSRLVSKLTNPVSPILLDVSPERLQPSLLPGSAEGRRIEESLGNFAASLAVQLKDAARALYVAPMVENLSLIPTITGFLCGYPVAYHSTSDRGETCLGGIPLHLVEVIAKTPTDARTLYTFTFPAVDAVEPSELDLAGVVDAWERSVKAEAALNMGCNDLDIRRSVTVRDHIVM